MIRIVVLGLVLLLVGTVVPLVFIVPPVPLTVASAPLVSLDPLEAAKNDDLRLLGALCEPLTRLDPATGQARPALAEAWNVTPDGLRWTFHLNRQARWRDGSMVVAAQVVAGLDRHRSQGSAFSDLLAAVRTVAAAGDRQVVFDLDRPVPDLAGILSVPVFAPLPPGSDRPEVWADPTRLVGNGPFVCTRFQIRHLVDLVPSPTYAGPHRAAQPVRLRIVGDPGTALRLYLDGQLAVIPSLTTDSAQALLAAGVPGVTRAVGWGTEIYRLRAGAVSPAQAAALSATLDREGLVRDLLHGLGSPALGLIPGVPSTPRALPPGVTWERPLDLLVPAGRPDRLRLAEHVVDVWKRQLGVTVRIITLPAGELAARERTGAYDLSRGSLLGDTPDPVGFLAAFTSGAGMNRTGWSDPAYDALVAAARSPGADQAMRLTRAQEHLLAAGVVLPLYHYAACTLARPGVLGAQANPWELLHMSDLRQ